MVSDVPQLSPVGNYPLKWIFLAEIPAGGWIRTKNSLETDDHLKFLHIDQSCFSFPKTLPLGIWNMNLFIYLFCLLNLKAPKDAKVPLTANRFFKEPLIHSYTSLPIHITAALQVKKTDNTSRREPKIAPDIGDSHPDGSPYIGRNQCQAHGGSFLFSVPSARVKIFLPSVTHTLHCRS